MTARDQTLITVVSGLPRSGTSLMMSMLEAGGLPPLTDDIRQADEDNPKGYYEYEHVKKLKEDAAWLAAARGKSVKVISALLMQLPAAYTYKVVFMRRNMREILASQRHMLVRRGEAGDPIGDEEMSALFSRHLQQVERWLAQQPNISCLYVDYNPLVLSPPESIRSINRFMGGWLDESAMARVVDPKLYRQKT